MTAQPVTEFLLLLGLAFFFGLAFEEFYGRGGQVRPGGVRSFPLLALVGALLYRLDTTRLIPLTGGLLVLGAWLTCYYRHHITEVDPEKHPNVGLMTAICNVLAYLLGPVTFAEPAWVAIGITVVAVLLLTARDKLHGFARRLEISEIVIAGKFLILAGLVLPFLPNTPLTSLTTITPYQVWLAVLAVCTISYGSYLLQRYVAPREGGLWTAVLGGLYSSTATTVVLARRASASPAALRQIQTGIVLATAIAFIRVLIIVAAFDWTLATVLAPALIGLAVLGLVMAGVYYRLKANAAAAGSATMISTNPLELSAAFVFAGLFVLVSLAAAWSRTKFGSAGLYALAAIVGATDIDPFVLSIASGSSAPLPVSAQAPLILVAASSNNVLKAIYTVGFAGLRLALVPAAALLILALAGAGLSWQLASF